MTKESCANNASNVEQRVRRGFPKPILKRNKPVKKETQSAEVARPKMRPSLIGMSEQVAG